MWWNRSALENPMWWNRIAVENPTWWNRSAVENPTWWNRSAVENCASAVPTEGLDAVQVESVSTAQPRNAWGGR